MIRPPPRSGYTAFWNGPMRISVSYFFFVCYLGAWTGLGAQTRYFVGVMGGVATLSADARSEITASSSAVSLYKPENGPTVQVFGGAHFTDYLSIEANYVWRENSVTLTSLFSGSGGSSQ